MKNIKRSIVLFQILCLLAVCGNFDAAAANQMPFYNHTNGLECESKIIYKELTGNSISVISIYGLKNASIQKYINDKIEQEALALYDKGLPPYRGIKVIEAKTQGERQLKEVACEITFNESNILSLLLNKYIHLGDWYITEAVPLSFDLRTGDIITLPDLFDADVDYQTVIRNYLSKGISENSLSRRRTNYPQEEDSTYVLLKPFEQIKETQKFIISSAGEIKLQLDYDTPEFAAKVGPVYLSIPAEELAKFGGEFVFINKYETWDESIYTGQFERQKMLLERGIDINRSWGPESRQSRAAFPNAELTVRTSVIEEIENQELAGRVKKYGQDPFSYLNAIKEELAIDEESSGYASFYYGTFRYGHYLTEIAELEAWGLATSTPHYNIWTVYDTITGKKLTLEDCFVPGFDYETLIQNEFLSRYQSYAEKENLQMGVDYFAIYDDQIIVWLDNDYEPYIQLYYDDIGEWNLRLFD